MKKEKICEVEKFQRAAMEKGLTYGQAQMMESARLMTPIKVPKGYTKIGDRTKNE